jgi:hypothetical protein
LKAFLWPLLQRLYGCEDVADFRSHYPNSLLESRLKIPLLYEKETSRGHEMDVEGEGTCEPYGSAIYLSPPSAGNYNSN